MTGKRNVVQAVGNLRTSSAANVGDDEASEPRQRGAIERFAKSAGCQIVERFDDPAVSGADPIERRPGFAALLNRVEDNGVRVLPVEDATRFARDLMAQELGMGVLIKLGMRLITANGDDLTETDDDMKVGMRQVAGAFSQPRRPCGCGPASNIKSLPRTFGRPAYRYTDFENLYHSPGDYDDENYCCCRVAYSCHRRGIGFGAARSAAPQCSPGGNPTSQIHHDSGTESHLESLQRSSQCQKPARRRAEEVQSGMQTQRRQDGIGFRSEADRVSLPFRSPASSDKRNECAVSAMDSGSVWLNGGGV
jgi:Resolvase, N terminal domain